jgi:hypothetical protein
MLPVWEIETFTCGADHVGHLVVITLTEARRRRRRNLFEPVGEQAPVGEAVYYVQLG